MARKSSCNEQSEEDPEKSSSSDDKKDGNEEISKYEKQRLSRIQENRARMEALGLASLSSSLFKGKGKKEEKKKKNVGVKTRKDDDDYQPSSEEEEEEDQSDDEFVSENDGSSGSIRALIHKEKNQNSFHTSKTKKNIPIQKHEEASAIDDDDALQKALALSLGDLADDPHMVASSGCNERKNGPLVQEGTGRKKRRKEKSSSRVQLTEDDVIRYFFSFDETGKGKITVRDLERVAVAHDFIWTEEEMREMIYIFSSDGDGKLNLDDFQSIVSRCNMFRNPETGE